MAQGERKEDMVEGTLVFVHGTGVRQDGFRRIWTDVQKGGKAHGMDHVDFHATAWGDRCGAPTGAVSLTLPPATITRSFDGRAFGDELDQTVELWAVLLEDPLLELRVAGGLEATDPRVMVGRLPKAAVARDQLDRLPSNPAYLEGSGLTHDDFSTAVSAVEESEELAQAAERLEIPELAWPIARAVVAFMLAAHRLDEPGLAPVASLDGQVRDALVTAIANALAPTTRTLTGWALRQTWRFVGPRATQSLVNRRLALMGQRIVAVADILFYQQRGGAIRDLITADLRDRRRPVVVVGHSLGGVILVDLLSQPHPPCADVLVTVGSQAPLFYAIDALANLRPDDATAPFTPWVNIYNPHDLLSFCAESIFDGAAGVVDHSVDPGVPFPESHSAYWRAPQVFDLIREAFRSAARH